MANGFLHESRRADRAESIEPSRRGTLKAMEAPVRDEARRLTTACGTSQAADGPDHAAARLERVLTCDPAMGVFRHADAGYEKAERVANERGVKIPGLNC